MEVQRERGYSLKTLEYSFKKSKKFLINKDESIKRLSKSRTVCKDMSICFHLAIII